MSSKKGKTTTCDRCGAQIFTELLGTETFDGGYSARDKFEQKPEGWASVHVCEKYTDLCPDCAKRWEEIGTTFLEGRM